jgi:hypothetical protein
MVEASEAGRWGMAGDDSVEEGDAAVDVRVVDAAGEETADRAGFEIAGGRGAAGV